MELHGHSPEGKETGSSSGGPVRRAVGVWRGPPLPHPVTALL